MYLYSISFFLDANQLDDPRDIWKREQEEMIREYVNRGKEDIDVSALRCTRHTQNCKIIKIHLVDFSRKFWEFEECNNQNFKKSAVFFQFLCPP